MSASSAPSLDSSVSSAPAPDPACISCGAALHGPYCHRCGEKRLDHHDYSLAHFLEHAVDTVTHFDLKVVKGIGDLLFRPGRMTADVLRGRRVPWPKPLQLFLVVNVLYVFLAHRVGMQVFNTPLRFHLGNWYGAWAAAHMQRLAAARHTTVAALTPQFNHLADTLSKTLVIAFIPLLAGVLALLLWPKRRYFLEHVLVATHFISQLLLVSLVMLGPFVLVMLALQALRISLDYQQRDTLSTGLMLALVSGWAYPLLRRAYQLRPVAGASAALVLGVVFFWLLKNVYRLLLFQVTYWLL